MIHKTLAACATIVAALLCQPAVSAKPKAAPEPTPAEKYLAMQDSVARGWNTWDTRSVMTHVLLPEAMAVQLYVADSTGRRPSRYLIGDRGSDSPRIHPRQHSYDGYYTDLDFNWHGLKLRVETAAVDSNELVMLITPLDGCAKGTLNVTPRTIWMRGNRVDCDSTSFRLQNWDRTLTLPGSFDADIVGYNRGSYTLSLDRPSAVSIGRPRSVDEVRAIVADHSKHLLDQGRERYGDDFDCYNAMQSILGWNSIYDPTIRRVITPVSRIWNTERFASQDFGGFCLYCWDTYFSAQMFSTDNRALAYANAVEMTKASDDVGFVPNCYYSNGFKSCDRSQPPVGSMTFWGLYNKYGDRWLLEYVYDNLLTWNRWWRDNRTHDGLICLGSSPYEKITYFRNEYDSNTRYGSILESGLDNSPMYDAATFDPQTHLLEQQDVGMTSLYIMDCRYLTSIAEVLGKKKDARELRERAEAYTRKLDELWDAENGFYYNRSTRDGKFNRRTSPTCFYPMLAGAASPEQAAEMTRRHMLNPDEYWTPYPLPACPKNDGGYKDNDYWRGRVWAPLNYLVYMGMRNYDNIADTRAELARKSASLLLKSWLSDGHIFENYNPDSGEGDDTVRSDAFYHWGALLAFVSLIENGCIDPSVWSY